jgi:hypothetical protein
VILVYPDGQFGPGKNGNESIRAWQGAPYSPVCKSPFLVDASLAEDFGICQPGVDDVSFTD